MNKLLRSAAAILMAGTMAFSAGVGTFAYEEKETTAKADALKTLNLFKGTDEGYELDKPLTRMEALILLVRLTGMEFDAIYGEWEHPFTDAPVWEGASAYIGYGYANKLTTGVSETLFDPDAQVDAQTYVTFVLRALGYTDGADGTVWDNWKTLAGKAGILPEGVNLTDFRRGDAVLISYAALDAKLNGEEATLSDKLIGLNVFGELSLAAAEIQLGKEVTADSELTDILAAIYAGVEDSIPLQYLYPMPVDDDTLSYYFGVEKLDYTAAIACEPMMSSRPHSVCLIRVKDGVDVEQAKKDIKAKVDPAKWLCVSVEPENVRVENIGSLILLVMDNGAPDALVNNFKALAD
ncbi:MAG: DUF4358 domain-containing protein [Clostridia bacterium]|nr:DUF4358 domain-containing protein [Clostridia bacterium]